MTRSSSINQRYRDTISFVDDARKVRARVRDGVLQPDNDYIPLCDAALYHVEHDFILVQAANEEYGFRATCYYGTDSLRDLTLPSCRPLGAAIDFPEFIARNDYLSTGLMGFEFERPVEAVLADSCNISGQWNASADFRLNLPLRDTWGPYTVSLSDATTTVETTIEALETLLRPFYHKNRLNSTPEIRIEDGTFRVDTYDDEGAHIWSDLPAPRVEGPDLVNRYPYRPLMLIARRFDGEVTLKTSPDEPLKVIHEEGSTKRTYLIDTVDE